MSELGMAARKYLDMGWSIIPVGPDKRPLVAWEPFQHRRAVAAELREWAKLKPTGIALVTGRISGVCCIDLDKYNPAYDEEKVLELIPDGITTPTTRTPRGGNHLIFAMPEGELRSKNGFMPGVDLKAEGGYIILPPSKNDVGKYEWIISPDDARPVDLSDAIKHRSLNLFLSLYKDFKSTGLQETSLTSTDFRYFSQGRRDEDLFHAANCLVRGGCEIPFIEKTLEGLALTCNPPFPVSEVPEKIRSAIQRAERRDRSIAAEVREWVMTSSGFFLTSEVFSELQLTSREQRKAATLELLRLAKAGIIERVGARRGSYRLIDKDIEVLDFLAAPGEEFQIDLPLGLSDLAVIYPKNLIVFAGSKDAGKTAFILDTMKRNIGRYPITYMNSEMGAVELRKRLQAHEDMNLDKWSAGMRAVYRGHSWADLIEPARALYGIDYVESEADKTYMAGESLKQIHEKLRDGVAVIGLQKKIGVDEARGGQFTKDKPRLYVALDLGGPGRPNRAKIISCKSFKDRNPRGMVREFRLHDGWKIEPLGYWKNEDK